MILWVEYYEKFPVTVPDNASINDIKEQIQNTLGIPLHNQLLHFSNNLLHNDFYVHHYGIDSEDELDLYAMRSFTIAYESVTYTVQISDEKSVGFLARHVGQQIGTSEATFILCWDEESLEDKTIRDYKIPDGVVLRAMPKMNLNIVEGTENLVYTVSVCGYTTVAKVKRILEDSAGLDKDTIRLMSPANSYSAAVLGDDVTMFGCGINGLDHNTLFLAGE